MDIANQKEDLRKEILKARNKLKKEEILKKSQTIEKRLFSLDEFKEAKVVMFYISFGSEVNTHFMVEDSLKIGKKVAVPFCETESQKLGASFITSFREDLEAGAYGILEPKKMKRAETPLSQIELILIPGLVFDLRGHRLGYGQGYYDKFLKEIPWVTVVGLAYELQIVERLPRFPHDIAVSKIITEARLISGRNRARLS